MIGLPPRSAEATASRWDRVPATTYAGRGRLFATPDRAGGWAWEPKFNGFMRRVPGPGVVPLAGFGGTLRA